MKIQIKEKTKCKDCQEELNINGWYHEWKGIVRCSRCANIEGEKNRKKRGIQPITISSKGFFPGIFN